MATYALKSDASTTIVAAAYFNEASSVTYAASQVMFGAAGATPTLVTSSVGLPVADAGGSLTVDAPVGTPVFVRLSDGSSAISALPVSGTISVTGVATAANQATEIASLQLIDDAIYAEDSASANGDKGMMVLAKRNDAGFGATSGADGDYEPLQLTDGRLLVNASGVSLTVLASQSHGEYANLSGDPLTNVILVGGHDGTYVRAISLTSAGLVNVSDGGGSLTVDYATTGSGTATGALRVELPTNGTGVIATVGAVTAITNALPAGTNAIGKLASNTGVTIGAVEIAAAQTLATVTTVSTVTTCSTLTGSGVAHDGADSGNPHKIGAKAESALSGITLVADGDRTDLYAGLDGVLIVRTDCNLEDVVQERTTNTDGASTAFASGLAAPGANIRLWVKSVTICNSSSSFCTVDLRDGSGGSVLWTMPVPATGGVTHVFDPPLKLTANTALAFDASAATTTLTISANGFKSKL